MKLNFLSSIFKQNNKTLQTLPSLLIKELKSLANLENILVYENATLYHNVEKVTIPFFILDSSKGIYLFEYKKWSYDDLKNASISKASQQDSTQDTLAFDKKQEFIDSILKEKLNLKVPIYNFLLMENLNADDYEHLDSSFKELLPKNRIIFNDTLQKEIVDKLSNVSNSEYIIPNPTDIISSLFPQYTIHNKKNIFLSSKEQLEFIHQDLQNNIILNGVEGSGKTSTIVSKVIFEKMQNKDINIIIIQPTTIACQKLKNRLSPFNLNSIEIITPMELINKHLRKLKKKQLEVVLHIDSKLMKDTFNCADLIICDDSHLVSYEFITYLKHLQKKKPLILVQDYISENGNTLIHNLNKNYRHKNHQIIFKQANPHAKSLQIIAKLLKNHKAKDILVVSDNLRKNQLFEDLEYFIKDKAILLDSSQNLFVDKLDGLVLSSYKQISSMETKFVILLDTCISPPNEVHYAINLSTDSSFIIYEEESNDIKELRIEYENR